MFEPGSKRSIGWPSADDDERRSIVDYIDLKLAALGLDQGETATGPLHGMAEDLLESYREATRLLDDYRCPVDQRIQTFLDRHLADVVEPGTIRLPSATLVLDRHGLARELSLPREGNEHVSPLLASFRVEGGVLHNPKSDRRTTKGVFHVAEGGLPIPKDKKAVPRRVFARLLELAFQPPADLLALPFTCGEGREPARLFCSLYLRPLVCPAIPTVQGDVRMETRFFVPGSLVANLDFVESIFGNAGDPNLPTNDAALDPAGWTGHTGCVILAPHLVGLKKKDLGLPHVAEATERHRHDGMCWESEDEVYNDGGAFKICCRTEEGVVVTIICDNYFGYCKKEVKTQISYSANLYGLAEEEHAGGALAFPSYALGDVFRADSRVSDGSHTFAEARALLGARFVEQPEGHGVDAEDEDILFVPEDVEIDVTASRVRFTIDGQERELKLRPGKVYVHPSGYKVHLEKHPGAPVWRLIGTDAEGTLCHKPCTVSGGGKSEISKSLTDSIIYGPLYVNDIDKDLELIDEILKRDYSDRYKPEFAPGHPSRPLLARDRSVGSVIKMLTPTETEYTPEYIAWLETIPNYIRALVYIVKRHYREEWGDDWKSHFSVDIVNGHPGHQLKYRGRNLVASYLRVGFDEAGAWRTFKVRQDFMPAAKIQIEDDITASVVVPAEVLGNRPAGVIHPSYKLVQNCEFRFFQRPDEAIVRGYDHQAEADLASTGNFISNFEPLDHTQVREIVEDAIGFDQFTKPMQKRLREAYARGEGSWAVSSAHPRIVDGKPTKNPRYLQVRPDLVDDRPWRLARLGARLRRRVPADEEVHFPVACVLPGRRNNPPDRQAGIRPLAVYGPIHYQELPELFMDFICSLTGKSPSTTGAGSEGALTKGPFNALRATADLNNTLVSFILSGYHAFSSAAGHVGPGRRVDHDVSLLMPEVWARIKPHERDPDYLLQEGYLERLEDFEHDGRPVLASRLGYRITERFCHSFLGRIFDNPTSVFDEAMLRPESQDLEAFVDGIHNICEAQERVARAYLDDGSIEEACPPLAALLYIMAEGSWEGLTIDAPEVREMFTREHLMQSDWYRERLLIKQQRDIDRWQRRCQYLRNFLGRRSHASEAARLGIPERLAAAEARLKEVQSLQYLRSLSGTIGADPLAPTSAGVSMSSGQTLYFVAPKRDRN